MNSLSHLGAAVCFTSLLGSPALAQTTSLVTNAVGGQTDNGSLYAEISADGRWITYQSGATNLVPVDTNDAPDIFLYDTLTGATQRVSEGSAGEQGNEGSLDPAISLDGKFVAWFAYASNLVPGDTNGVADIFVRDVQAGTTARVSVGPLGVEANGASRYPAVSGDGRYVSYETWGTNIVAGDTNGVRDIYVYDSQAGTTVRASLSASGQEGDGYSLDSSLSPDGRFVAFESVATNLVPGDTNGVSDVFVKDLLLGSIVRVSVDSSGSQGNGGSYDPILSEGGTRVSFSSDASNLVSTDGNGYEDVFVHDLTTGITERVSVASDGTQGHIGGYDAALSADGNFVTFYSTSSNLVPDDTNSLSDIFVRDMLAGTTERVSIGSYGQQGDGESFYSAITPGGRYVAFDSYSENLIVGDVNAQRDIFIHDRYSPYQPFCNTTPNSVGPGAVMGLNGSVSITANDMRLEASGCPPNQFGVFYYGSDQIQLPFGDGFRCVGGSQVFRLPVVSTGAGGSPSYVVDYGNPPTTAGQISAGSVWSFQFWYRDPSGPGGSGFNLSDGIEITFDP